MDADKRRSEPMKRDTVQLHSLTVVVQKRAEDAPLRVRVRLPQMEADKRRSEPMKRDTVQLHSLTVVVQKRAEDAPYRTVVVQETCCERTLFRTPRVSKG
jgi:hypothetical protein